MEILPKGSKNYNKNVIVANLQRFTSQASFGLHPYDSGMTNG